MILNYVTMFDRFINYIKYKYYYMRNKQEKFEYQIEDNGRNNLTSVVFDRRKRRIESYVHYQNK